MKKIFKYKINVAVNDYPSDIPSDAEILSVQVQNGSVCVWAVIDDESFVRSKKTTRAFGTGWDIENREEYSYLATIQEQGLVLHIFEKKEKK